MSLVLLVLASPYSLYCGHSRRNRFCCLLKGYCSLFWSRRSFNLDSYCIAVFVVDLIILMAFLDVFAVISVIVIIPEVTVVSFLALAFSFDVFVVFLKSIMVLHVVLGVFTVGVAFVNLAMVFDAVAIW